MTALDQAFIKAYKHQKPADRSTPLAAPSARAGNIDSEQIEAQTTSIASKHDDVMAALQKPSGKIAATPADAPAASDTQQYGENEGKVLVFDPPSPARAANLKSAHKKKKKTPSAPTLDVLDVPEAVYRLDPPSPTIPDAPRGASFTALSPQEKSLPEHNANSPPYDTADFASTAGARKNELADARSSEAQQTRRFDPPQGNANPGPEPDRSARNFHPESAIRVFQPMLQVDHFAWPKICQRLESAAAAELDRLAGSLMAAAKQGLKVVGIGSGQRGDGATTMLLCAARRLAKQNVKTVLVDADLAEPQLAKRLGLLPQLGWEDVAAGRQPVEEVLVESVADRLAVMPLCAPLAIADFSYASQRIMAESLLTLRKNYDLVLMDLGPLEIPQSLDDLASNGLNCRIDAVTFVHKMGKILATCLPAVRKTLASAGVAVTGVVENFVPQTEFIDT
jgi:Mrp family chromosome partitioning ATPase